MIISTATLALLRGDAAPELSRAPGRVIKPMGEIERPKEYKTRQPRTPTASQPAEPAPAEPMEGVNMDALHLISAEKIAVEDGYNIDDFRSSLLERDSVLRTGAVGVPIARPVPEPEPVGPTIKGLIANCQLDDPEQPTIEFTNLDVQRAFDLTETEAFNFTQALVQRGSLTRDLMQDADGRVFYLFSTGRNHVV